ARPGRPPFGGESPHPRITPRVSTPSRCPTLGSPTGHAAEALNARSVLFLFATTTFDMGCAMKSPEQEFEDRYQKWIQAVAAMPRYSKSTAFTQLPEYRSLVAVGPP